MSAAAAYAAVFSAQFRTLLQYRAAAIAGMATQIFWGFIRIMLFHALYLSATGTPPMSEAQIVTYVWLVQAFLNLVPMRIDPDVRQLMRDGNVAIELLKPVSFYGIWLMRAIAARAAPTLLRAVPLLTVASLFLGLAPPASVEAALLFVPSLVLGLLVSGAFVTILHLTMLMTIGGEGVTGMGMALVLTFSGNIVPLPFFPDSVLKVVYLLPFRAINDTPFRVYMGHLAGPEAYWALAHQVVWVLVLLLAGRSLARWGLRRLVVQGG